MALQGSGQIKLSEIAAEYGGSVPHALSEYHDKGIAPASGEIQIAADFYGTSNTFSFNITSNAYGPIDFSFEILDEYCCNCIDYIELSSDDETYTIESSDIHTFSFSTYMPPGLPPSEMILSFNLKVGFLSSER